MIQLNKHTDYAIVILSHFARLNDAPLLSAKSVSIATHISLPMVSKILKILVKGGVLKSHQGVKGGYQLSRSASDISITDIIEIMDGPLAIVECTTNVPGACKTESACSIRPHWSAINHTIRDALKNLSLASMTAPVANAVGFSNFFPLLIKK